MKMRIDLTKEIYHFVKKNEIVTIDEIRKEFPNYDITTINYHLKKVLEFGIEKLRRGIYSNGYPDIYLLLMKFDEGNIIAYHTALEFYGLGHTEFFTKYAINSKTIKDIEDVAGLTFKFVKPTLNHYHDIIRNNKKFRVTSLEGTFLDCLLNLKYCGGFEEFFRCVSSINVNEIKLSKNKTPSYEEERSLNLNYLFILLKEYNVKKLYNLTGFILDSLKEYYNLNVSENFLEKIKKEIRTKPVILNKSHSNNYTHNKIWNVKIPIEDKSTIEGIY